MFSLANPDNRALFFTVLGEPALKMLRYQQQFPFFDVNKVNESIRFINLATDLLDGDFDHVMSHITKEVRDFDPRFVFVDSFRSVAQTVKGRENGASNLQKFIQQLGMQMTSWQATTFLIGEYLAPESEASPIFTVADGILWLTQNLHRNSLVRKIQVVKMRGQAQAPGLHTFRINDQGIQVFPRAIIQQGAKISTGDERVAMGVPGLDEMLGGGLPAGYSLLLVGPSGSGTDHIVDAIPRRGCAQGRTRCDRGV